MNEKKKAKVEKEFPDFVDVVVGMSVQELEARLLSYAKEAEAIDNAKEEKIGAKLQAMKEEKKTLEGPFRDAKKANGLKRTYLVHLIGEKGGNDES